jgi:hypothetical protein
MARGPMAGVSGPGKFSKRTDGLSFQSTEYGSGVENAANKAGAPLASTPDVRGITNTELRQAVSAAATPVTPLFSPSARPGEPITTGVDIGPGAGSSILGMAPTAPKTSDTLAKLLPFDSTGEIAILYQQALARGD